MTTTGISNGATLVNATIAAGNIDIVSDDYYVYLEGELVNAGTFALDSTGDNTDLIVNSQPLILTGGGTLLLSDFGGNRIYGQGSANDTLVNVNNTIEGAGNIGLNSDNNPLFVTNDAAGIIDANQGVSLVIEAGVVNDGLIEATGAGGLAVSGCTITQEGGGRLLASGAGHDVYIEGRSDIVGGLLLGTGGGLFELSFGNTLDGSEGAAITIGTSTTVELLDTYQVYLSGTVDNLGTLADESTGDNTDLIVNSPTLSLTGGGTLLLSDFGGNRIFGQGGSNDTLANVNNTIEGAGYIGLNSGNNPLFFVNEARGVVNADQGTALVIEAGVTNAGLIEATGIGGLVISGCTVTGQAGGTLLASGAGHDVYIEDRADIVGDLLLGTGGGLFELSSGNTLDGSEGAAVTIGASTTVELLDNNQVYLFGTIDNLGTFADESSGDYTDLIVNSPTVSLTGGGTLLLSDFGTNRIYGHDGTNDTLANVSDSIQGAGYIGLNSGNNPLFFVNEARGVVNADQGTALVIEAGVTNDGLLEATGAGGLVIDGNTVTNGATGTIAAYDSSAVVFDNNSDLTNLANGTLSGGTYGAYAVDGSSGLSISGNGVLSADAADIILSGTHADIFSYNQSNGQYAAVEASLTEIAAGGTLQLLNGKIFDAASHVTIEAGGEMILGHATFAGGLDNKGVLIGSGSVSSAITNKGVIEAEGGALVIAAKISGGSLVIGAGGTLVLDQTAKAAASFAAAGTLALDDSKKFKGEISGFTSGDMIELANFAATSKSFNDGKLTLSNGSAKEIFKIDGNFFTGDFTLTANGKGTEITTAGAGSYNPGAVTLSPAKRDVVITAPMSGAGDVGVYQITSGGSGFLETISADLFGAAGTDFTIQNKTLIESNSSSHFDAGIVLGAAGRVTNDGTILAANGILDFAGSNAAYLENTKLIDATLGIGIDLQGAGQAGNSGTIFAAGGGIEVTGGGYVSNSGAITAAAGDGVDLASGTLFESGTITALAGDAVSFGSGAGDLMIITPSAKLTGAVRGGGGTLELAAQSGKTGIFSAAELASFTNFATIEIGAKAVWDLSGAVTTALALVNDGKIAEAKTDTLTIDGAVSGAGTIDVSAAPLTLNGGVGSGQQIVFSGTGETLVLGDAAAIAGKIEGFALGDTIDLSGVASSAIQGTHFAGGVLTLDATGGDVKLTFASPAGFGSDVFDLAADGHGTMITLTKPGKMGMLAPDAVSGGGLMLSDENPSIADWLLSAVARHSGPAAQTTPASAIAGLHANIVTVQPFVLTPMTL
jgi:hypothetical protein